MASQEAEAQPWPRAKKSKLRKSGRQTSEEPTTPEPAVTSHPLPGLVASPPTPSSSPAPASESPGPQSAVPQPAAPAATPAARPAVPRLVLPLQGEEDPAPAPTPSKPSAPAPKIHFEERPGAGSAEDAGTPPPAPRGQRSRGDASTRSPRATPQGTSPSVWATKSGTNLGLTGSPLGAESPSTTGSPWRLSNTLGPDGTVRLARHAVAHSRTVPARYLDTKSKEEEGTQPLAPASPGAQADGGAKRLRRLTEQDGGKARVSLVQRQVERAEADRRVREAAAAGQAFAGGHKGPWQQQQQQQQQQQPQQHLPPFRPSSAMGKAEADRLGSPRELPGSPRGSPSSPRSPHSRHGPESGRIPSPRPLTVGVAPRLMTSLRATLKREAAEEAARAEAEAAPAPGSATLKHTLSLPGEHTAQRALARQLSRMAAPEGESPPQSPRLHQQQDLQQQQPLRSPRSQTGSARAAGAGPPSPRGLGPAAETVAGAAGKQEGLPAAGEQASTGASLDGQMEGEGKEGQQQQRQRQAARRSRPTLESLAGKGQPTGEQPEAADAAAPVEAQEQEALGGVQASPVESAADEGEQGLTAPESGDTGPAPTQEGSEREGPVAERERAPAEPRRSSFLAAAVAARQGAIAGPAPTEQSHKTPSPPPSAASRPSTVSLAADARADAPAPAPRASAAGPPAAAEQEAAAAKPTAKAAPPADAAAARASGGGTEQQAPPRQALPRAKKSSCFGCFG